MVTGGLKTLSQAESALSEGSTDLIGLARSLVLDPILTNRWLENQRGDPVFPRFQSPPEGGITAWYTMRLPTLVKIAKQTRRLIWYRQ